MHNTLWVPAHFHSYYLLGAVAFTWAYMYHLVAELSGAQETRLSRIAAWLYGLGGAGFLLMFFFSGANSVPRRFAVHLPEWQGFAQVAVVFVVILALALAWVTIEVFRSVKPAWQRAQ
jgi:cytochrome c oxidase subunit 1